MQGKSDISALFGRFGADPERYRSLMGDKGLQEAIERWPLLASIATGAAHHDAAAVNQ